MNEDNFNMSIRKFLKMTGVGSQREIEQAVSKALESGQIDGTGKLITYSKLKFAPVGFEDDLPYSIAVVDYGDYKIFGRIASDIPDEDIQMGMAMKTAANKLPNGQLNYVFIKA